ncbi:hypothetical protein Tco_0575467 [Tanacetum coccineum]
MFGEDAIPRPPRAPRKSKAQRSTSSTSVTSDSQKGQFTELMQQQINLDREAKKEHMECETCGLRNSKKKRRIEDTNFRHYGDESGGRGEDRGFEKEDPGYEPVFGVMRCFGVMVKRHGHNGSTVPCALKSPPARSSKTYLGLVYIPVKYVPSCLIYRRGFVNFCTLMQYFNFTQNSKQDKVAPFYYGFVWDNTGDCSFSQRAKQSYVRVHGTKLLTSVRRPFPEWIDNLLTGKVPLFYVVFDSLK